MERDESRGEQAGKGEEQLAEELERAVADAVTAEVKLPCRFSVRVVADRNRHGPDRQPPPTVETIAREASIWLRIIEPDPDRAEDRPRATWTLADRRRVRLQARLRPQEAWNEPVVEPNPFAYYT